MSPKLYRLPSGTWIDPHAVTSVTVIPSDAVYPCYVGIDTGARFFTVRALDALHAEALADGIAADLNKLRG